MYEALVALCKLCAPITPFLTEEIYIKLTGEKSVHLADYPTYKEELINACEASFRIPHPAFRIDFFRPLFYFCKQVSCIFISTGLF